MGNSPEIPWEIWGQFFTILIHQLLHEKLDMIHRSRHQKSIYFTKYGGGNPAPPLGWLKHVETQQNHGMFTTDFNW
jgi:hypothetical protein